MTEDVIWLLFIGLISEHHTFGVAEIEMLNGVCVGCDVISGGIEWLSDKPLI